MINEAHAQAGHHRDFLRRAVAPNLFTSTLHPEFIPALVAANLMTPQVWEWAKKAVPDPSSPVAALRGIHRFLNKHFHHAIGGEFAAIWGLQEERHLTDPDEKAASEYAMRVIARAIDLKGGEFPWTLPLVPLLKDGLFPLYVYGTADVLRVHGRRLGKRTLGVTSCLDECVLAASLALAAGVCRWEDVIFLGSPFHYTVFLLTREGPVWFNAKREIFSTADWEQLCAGHDADGRTAHFTDKLVVADRLICGHGLAVMPEGRLAGDAGAVARAVAAIENFNGVPVPWLQPPPGHPGDHLFHGCEAIMAGWNGGAAGLQRAILARAHAGGAPVLEAALYMYRHPEFCHPEVLRQAARKNFYAYLHATAATSLDELHAMVDAIPGRESFYGGDGRMALPDEVLAFGTASDAERELLRSVMHEHFTAR